MDVQRANQIIKSPEKIEVRYQGAPIWIDSVDQNTQTARVHFETNPTDHKTVPVWDLEEIH